MRSFLKIGFRPAEIFVCTLFVFSSLTFAGTYSGGSGTVEDPYKISTVADWQELIDASEDWDKSFILLNDIDFGGVNLAPIGNDTTAFIGVFDGKGHTISGFTSPCRGWDPEEECRDDLKGLFGKNLGTLRNLGLLNCQIEGRLRVGSLAGDNDGIIANCFSTGSVSGTHAVGGLAGSNLDGMIINCYSWIHVRGGFATGSLVGVFGENGTISNCYSIRPGEDAICGLVGDYWGQGDIQNSFWETSTGGEPNLCGSGIGKTTAEMKTLATFTDAGWDFVYSDGNPPVWKMGPDGYPALFWEFRYSGGSGTAEDPYTISTVADWQELIGTSGDWDKSFLLTADLDFTGAVITPVGIYGTPFTGVMDGASHTLSNLKIDVPECGFVGLFGSVSGGQIKNLGVVNANITSFCTAGGLVGYSYDGTITSCYASGTVKGDSCGGGLVGECYFGSISSCYATNTVTGYSSNGGLVGYNESGTISSCYATGTVDGDENVGGLAGINSSGTIMACYATGAVSGAYDIGGLVGINTGTIRYCYATGTVTGYSEEGVGLVGNHFPGTISDCFWDIQTSGLTTSDGGEGKTTAEMKTLSTFTDAGWDFAYSDGNPPVWKMGPDGYPALFWEYRYSGGSGTAEDPYTISTVADWQELIATSADWDTNFVLLNDIDFGGMNLTPVAPDVDPTTYDFQGIPFTGKFNGNGHNLRNSIIDFPDKDFVGLFGYLNSGAEVWNLGADDITVTGRSHVGGLCGDNRCKIVNCSSSGDIRGSDCFVGGLCGYNYGIISRCYSSGNVNGYYSTGGLCGHNYSGTISECYASGAVSGIALVGGLCGINEYSIQGCYAIGQVYGISEVGGLVGFFPGYGYSEGKVLDGSWYEERGGSVGAGNSPSFKESYWDAETSGLSTSFMGEGMTTAQMKTFSTFTEAGWDFVGESANGSEDVWRMCEDGIDYPRLSWEFSGSGDFDCPDGVAMEDLLYLSERWLAGTPETVGAADVNGDGKVTLEDFAVMAENWLNEGPGYLVEYQVQPCQHDLIPPPGELRFSVTVNGRYIHVADAIVANCCVDRIQLTSEVSGSTILFHERELMENMCNCICTFPTTAVLGPFEPGTYTFTVLQSENVFHYPPQIVGAVSVMIQ